MKSSNVFRVERFVIPETTSSLISVRFQRSEIKFVNSRVSQGAENNRADEYEGRDETSSDHLREFLTSIASSAVLQHQTTGCESRCICCLLHKTPAKCEICSHMW